MSAVSAPYQPGQAPWPDNQQQRPDRPPPLQFQQEGDAPRSNQALAWTLRVVGLILVAVLSGVVWWYIRYEGSNASPTGYGGAETEKQSSGKYDFTQELSSPRVDQACDEHAYGDTEDFFRDTPCDRLTRSVFTTRIEGRTIYTSVAVVEMPDEAKATELQELTDTDGSGNVSDLVREDEVEVEGLKQLSKGGGYASARQGDKVTIVEADYDPAADEGGSEGELDDVCKDAIRLGGDMTASGG